MPDVLAIRVRGPRRHLGAVVEVRTSVLSIGSFTDVMEVTTWDPPVRMAIRHLGLVKGTGEWRLDPLASGSRFTWTEAIHVAVPLLGEAGLRVYSPFLRMTFRRAIRNLAHLLDRSAGSAR